MTYGGDLQAAAGVREGDVIAGKYRVEKIVGAGGMGVVFAARHLQLDEKVALKFLLPQALESPEAVARFLREARAAVKIKSEHVARVSDVGTLESGSPYMVMEYLDGGDLAARVRRQGALPIEQAVEFVLQACVAVADAHALGIVHRDLKPANLFCVRRSDGQLSIKVLDFGISKMSEPSRSSGPAAMSMTRTSAIMGSPLYMSPEQMQSPKDVGPPTDLWALGVVLFELLTARVPFGGETYAEIAVKVATQPPPRVRALRPEVPEGLEAAIEKCLVRDPRGRHANVGQLALALLPFAPKRANASVERISGILRAAGLSATALDEPTPATENLVAGGTIAPVGGTSPGIPRRSKAAIGGVAATLAAVLVAVIAVKAWPSHVDPQRDDDHGRWAGAGASDPRQPPPPTATLQPPERATGAGEVQGGSPAAAAPAVARPEDDAGSTGTGNRLSPRERGASSPASGAQAHPKPVAPVAETVSALPPPPAPPAPPPQPEPNVDPLAKLRPKS